MKGLLNAKKIFHIITMSTYGTGLSGGDRIWIEIARRIGQKYPTYIYLWEEGLSIAQREELKQADFILWSAKKWAGFGFIVNYFARIIIALWKSLRLKIENSQNTILYSASEFWQDSLPAFILKMRYPQVKWVAAWYMSSPNPFVGFKEQGRFQALPDWRVLAYWIIQQPVKFLIRHFADFIFVTSKPDENQFPKHRDQKKVLVIKGGVDLDKVRGYQLMNKQQGKIYSAVFQGRLHPQKGLLELIDIWKKVIKVIPDAKLAIIGDGSLMEDIKLRIKNEKLEKNVKLFGYVFDGNKKYDIFLSSKIVVHPAIYDSGGMAAAEAMAFGLPGVSFDLEALKTYYPSGMIKVPIGDNKRFAEQIVHLLTNQSYYDRISKSALTLIHNNWSWDLLAKKVLWELNQ